MLRSHHRSSRAFAAIIILLGLAVVSVAAFAHEEEPTQESCDAAVGEARALAASVPASDVSRYFAERDIHQALIEAGNGEFDDCVEKAERAVLELRERHHVLQPGERLDILGAHELPQR